MTPTFASEHGNFDHMEGMGHNGTKSIVCACCCYSGKTGAGMPDAYLAAWVDAYLGWSETVKALFAAQRQILFFYNTTDTCASAQSYYGIGNLTDPKTAAQLLYYATDTVVIRSQMRFSKDGTQPRGYSVGIALASGVTTVNCLAGRPLQEPEYAITVHFPGAGPGSRNCLSTEDAEMLVTDFNQSGRYFIVKKDYVGVSGTIEVTRSDDYIVSGTFSGTLGHWTPGQNPEEDQPAETIEIQNGIFEHVGLRQ